MSEQTNEKQIIRLIQEQNGIKSSNLAASLNKQPQNFSSMMSGETSISVRTFSSILNLMNYKVVVMPSNHPVMENEYTINDKNMQDDINDIKKQKENIINTESAKGKITREDFLVCMKEHIKSFQLHNKSVVNEYTDDILNSWYKVAKKYTLNDINEALRYQEQFRSYPIDKISDIQGNLDEIQEKQIQEKNSETIKIQRYEFLALIDYINDAYRNTYMVQLITDEIANTWYDCFSKYTLDELRHATRQLCKQFIGIPDCPDNILRFIGKDKTTAPLDDETFNKYLEKRKHITINK